MNKFWIGGGVLVLVIAAFLVFGGGNGTHVPPVINRPDADRTQPIDPTDADAVAEAREEIERQTRRDRERYERMEEWYENQGRERAEDRAADPDYQQEHGLR